jgi:hypothetical protein
LEYTGFNTPASTRRQSLVHLLYESDWPRERICSISGPITLKKIVICPFELVARYELLFIVSASGWIYEVRSNMEGGFSALKPQEGQEITGQLLSRIIGFLNILGWILILPLTFNRFEQRSSPTKPVSQPWAAS